MDERIPLESTSPSRERAATTGYALFGFLALNIILLIVFFWPAVSGKCLLSPLDIPPHFFSKYHYLDSNATGVPANHYIIDLILGDVSRNFLVHDAWRRGEMPWWDPYTDGGKPLAAEANAVNISDPIKLICFRTLPFEVAYNCVRIIPFLLCGVSVFLLLRAFRFSGAIAGAGALLYEFAGCNFVAFFGPTIQAPFAYYPILWLAWHKSVTTKKPLWHLFSVLPITLIFLSGNLQSHSFAFVFGAIFIAGYAWRDWRQWTQLTLTTGGTLVAGLLLASPFILSQIELFFLSTRDIEAGSAKTLATGIVSITSIYPWLMGTFRTLDLSKAVNQSSLSFWLYIGSAALCIAAFGACSAQAGDRLDRRIKRTARLLVGWYLVICSTPLIFIFYQRIAWLAVLGLVILFACGAERLIAAPKRHPRWAIAVTTVAFFVALTANVGALVIYPKFKTRIEEKFVSATRQHQSLDVADELRKFQIANFANEVSFKNVETLAAFASLVLLAAYFYKAPQNGPVWMGVILAINLIPLLLFGHRFVPMHPMEHWHKLRVGGPEQQRVAEALRGEHLRLLENAPGMHDFVFPGALAQLQRVHVLHGHTSLHLKTGATTLQPPLYDYEYRSTERGAAVGELVRTAHPMSSRFQWSDSKPRPVHVESETLNTLSVSFEPADGKTDFIRTDSFYPGWRAFADGHELQIAFEPPCSSRVQIPAGTKSVRFIYEPRWWRTGLRIAAGTCVTLAIAFVILRRKRFA